MTMDVSGASAVKVFEEFAGHAIFAAVSVMKGSGSGITLPPGTKSDPVKFLAELGERLVTPDHLKPFEKILLGEDGAPREPTNPAAGKPAVIERPSNPDSGGFNQVKSLRTMAGRYAP